MELLIDTGNETPSVSVSLVKADSARGLDDVQRYLNQQDELIHNVQNINNAVILVKEMILGFQQPLATVTKENHALKETR